MKNNNNKIIKICTYNDLIYILKFVSSEDIMIRAKARSVWQKTATLIRQFNELPDECGHLFVIAF